MALAYGVGGIVKTAPAPLTGQGAPSGSFKGQLGQQYFDNSTSPPTEYTYNGSTWQTGGNAYATTSTPGIVTLSEDISADYPSELLVPHVKATKDYVDSVAIAGAPVSTTTTAGIGQLSTDAEAVAGTPSTALVALFVTPSNLSAVFAAPPTIGGTTPAGGAFTTLSASGAFSLTGDQVQVAEGGTGTATLTDHGIMLGSGTSAVSVTAVGTNNQVLIGQTGADPIWTTNLDLPGTLDVTGAGTFDSTLDVVGLTTLSDLDIGNLNITGNTISSTDTNGDINLTPDGTGNVVAANLTLTSPMNVASGGTGLATITDHGVMVGSGTGNVTPLSVGTNGQVLLGSTGADPVFATLSSTDSSITFATGAGTLDLSVTPATEAQAGGLETATDAEAVAVTATNKIIVPSNLAAVFAEPPAIGSTTPAAGTFTTATLSDINASYTDHGVLLGQGATTNLVATSAGTNGQLFVGSTGADPAFATAGSTLSSITNTLGAGTFSQDISENWLRVATVSIATGDVLTLATTPYELVAAPGAGKIIEFISAQIILDYNSIPYTESADNMAIRYTDGSGVIVSQTIETTGFIDQASDTITNALPKIDAIVAATGSENQALVLDNTGSNFAAGNSDLIVKISYRVITTGL